MINSPNPNVMGKLKKKKKFSVTCYFAVQFDVLRKRCCVGELDFMRSLSCCSAIGEKTNNNANFAKSFDERFIIKQVTKSELESFVNFAHDYFRYLIQSLGEKTPTCLTKILGIYQVRLLLPSYYFPLHRNFWSLVEVLSFFLLLLLLFLLCGRWQQLIWTMKRIRRVLWNWWLWRIFSSKEKSLESIVSKIL